MSQWQSPTGPGSVPPGPPTSGPARRSRRPLIITLVVVVVVVVLVVAGVLVVSGVFTRDGDGAAGASPSAAAPTPSVAPTPEEIPGKTIGTPTNPYAPGDSFTFLDDWTFSLGATDFDTWPDVGPALEQKFPDSIDTYLPKPGMVFVSAAMTMTYTGPPTYQGRITGIHPYYITADGTALTNGTCGAFGDAVKPFDLSDALELPSVEGSVCAQMTPAQAAGGQWRIWIVYVNEGDRTEYFREIFYTAA